MLPQGISQRCGKQRVQRLFTVQQMQAQRLMQDGCVLKGVRGIVHHQDAAKAPQRGRAFPKGGQLRGRQCLKDSLIAGWAAVNQRQAAQMRRYIASARQAGLYGLSGRSPEPARIITDEKRTPCPVSLDQAGRFDDIGNLLRMGKGHACLFSEKLIFRSLTEVN